MVILTWTLSIISLLTTMLGLYWLGNKNKNGFLVFNVSLNCQLVLFYLQSNYFLITQMVILIAFNTWNYLKWRKDEGIKD